MTRHQYGPGLTGGGAAVVGMLVDGLRGSSTHRLSVDVYWVALGCPNGTWVDNDRVIIDDLSEEPVGTLYLVDVRSGSSRRLSRPPQWAYYLALIDGHLLARARDGNLYLTDLDGNDSEPFLTMPADLGISTFDIAPYAINIG